MIEFDNSVFELNTTPDHQFFQTSWGRIIVTDHFYNDPSGVREEVLKMPLTRTDYDSPDMYDARGTFIDSIKGNQLPFVSQWCEWLGNQTGSNIAPNDVPSVLINANKILSTKHQDFFFNPHVDQSDFTTIVFLNDEYLTGDGFNIYRQHTNLPVWITRHGPLQVEVFVQGRPNRAVTFQGNAIHGMEVKTSFFTDQIRLTQAFFTKKAE